MTLRQTLLILACLSFLPFHGFAKDLGSFVDDVIHDIGHQNNKGYAFDILPSEGLLSGEYLIRTTKGAQIGTSKRTSFHLDLRTHYELYNNNKEFIGYGIRRLLSSGSAWQTEIDVYQPGQSTAFGYIDGQEFTEANPHFSIYQDGVKIGIGHLDKKTNTITICDAEHGSSLLASFKRNYVSKNVDYWSVFVSDNCKISPLIIEIFATYAIDNQDSFTIVPQL